MSPYLYVICIERLIHLIGREVQYGCWKPVRASRHGPPISNLAFANDLLLFCEATPEQARIMKSYLEQFFSASGSKVNNSKSRIYFSHNTNLDVKDVVCKILSMEVTEDLGMYLGVPTIKGKASKSYYQYLVEKINSKLSGLNSKTLSIARRATLAQSSLC